MTTQSVRDELNDQIDAVLALPDLPNDAKALIVSILSRVDDVEAARDEFEEERDTVQQALDERGTAQDAALEHVKDWMLGVLVHGKPMSDPRKVLRIVEDALI